MQSYIRSLILTGFLGMCVPLSAMADEPASDPFQPFPDQLAPSLFNEVQDRDFRGIVPEEKTLYYYVLKHLQETSLKDQKQAAAFNLQQRRSELKTFKEHPQLKLPLFPDIFKNSSRYKGRLVTLTGRVRKLMHYPAEKNDYGIKTLYEAWLFTDASQQNPTVVVCTEVPPALQDGLPKGIDVIDHVTLGDDSDHMLAIGADHQRANAQLIKVLAHLHDAPVRPGCFNSISLVSKNGVHVHCLAFPFEKHCTSLWRNIMFVTSHNAVRSAACVRVSHIAAIFASARAWQRRMSS